MGRGPEGSGTKRFKNLIERARKFCGTLIFDRPELRNVRARGREDDARRGRGEGRERKGRRKVHESRFFAQRLLDRDKRGERNGKGEEEEEVRGGRGGGVLALYKRGGLIKSRVLIF